MGATSLIIDMIALMGMTTGTGSSAIVQLFSYDASGKVVAVDYSKGGSSFTTYYYLRNAQGDIVKLIDGSGATVVEYLYDTWGKLLEITGTLKDTVGTNQPFCYRGYVYDNETGWYYLQSRYYNPEIGRFISADVLLSTGQGVIGHNAYAYCGNNPVSRVDEEGDLWQLIAAGIGAVVGVVSQFVTDVVVSVATTGEISLSSWQTYVGAAVGGAAEGFVFASTGSTVLASAVGSGTSTLVTEGLTKITVPTYNKTWGEIAGEVVADTIVGAATGYVLDKIPEIKVKGLNSGRNSYGAVFKSGMTKLKHGTARRMSWKVMGKGLVYNLFGNIYGVIWESARGIVLGE